jgi:hypothetical protein
VLGEMSQKVICTFSRRIQKACFPSPIVSLCESKDSPSLTAGPARVVRVALVGNALLYGASGLVEVYDMVGGGIGSDVVLLGGESVGGGNVEEVRGAEFCGGPEEEVEV